MVTAKVKERKARRTREVRIGDWLVIVRRLDRGLNCGQERWGVEAWWGDDRTPGPSGVAFVAVGVNGWRVVSYLSHTRYPRSVADALACAVLNEWPNIDIPDLKNDYLATAIARLRRMVS